MIQQRLDAHPKATIFVVLAPDMNGLAQASPLPAVNHSASSNSLQPLLQRSMSSLSVDTTTTCATDMLGVRVLHHAACLPALLR